MNTWQIAQGSSTDIKQVTIENIDDYTDYYSTVAVVDEYSKEPIGVTFSVSPDKDDGFTVGLLPGNTELIEPGRYLVVFEISKGIDPVLYRKEISWLLEVSPSLVN